LPSKVFLLEKPIKKGGKKDCSTNEEKRRKNRSFNLHFGVGWGGKRKKKRKKQVEMRTGGKERSHSFINIAFNTLVGKERKELVTFGTRKKKKGGFRLRLRRCSYRKGRKPRTSIYLKKKGGILVFPRSRKGGHVDKDRKKRREGRDPFLGTADLELHIQKRKKKGSGKGKEGRGNSTNGLSNTISLTEGKRVKERVVTYEKKEQGKKRGGEKGDISSRHDTMVISKEKERGKNDGHITQKKRREGGRVRHSRSSFPILISWREKKKGGEETATPSTRKKKGKKGREREISKKSDARSLAPTLSQRRERKGRKKGRSEVGVRRASKRKKGKGKEKRDISRMARSFRASLPALKEKEKKGTRMT